MVIMHTERLYYEDAYRRQFSARVVRRRELDGRPAVALDRTAFYPTGGGQPHDTGWLNGIRVLDVREDQELVWHLLEQPLTANRVEGELDWPRRWDHMQSHSGQHVLSQAFIRVAEVETVGWHLSPNSLTIDVDQVILDETLLQRAEELANSVVQEDRPIRSRYAEPSETAALALRKQLDVCGTLRLVEIEDFDQVACGGTHVASTGQIGLIKILRVERQGNETRVHFLCGGRALNDYRRKHEWLRQLANDFSCREDEVTGAVERLRAEVQAARRARRQAWDALVEVEAERLWQRTEGMAPPRLITGYYADWEPDQVKRLALSLRRRPGCFVTLAAGDPPQMFLARSDDLEIGAGDVCRRIMSDLQGRGGGRGEYAQGRVPSPAAAYQAFALLADLLAVVPSAKARHLDR